MRGESSGAERAGLDQVQGKNFSMGICLTPACKVFVKMAERKIISKFAKLFGGLQTYFKRSRMVVVWFNLELFCKIPKVAQS